MPIVSSKEGRRFQIPQEVLDKYALTRSPPIEEAVFLNGQLIVQVFWTDDQDGT